MTGNASFGQCDESPRARRLRRLAVGNVVFGSMLARDSGSDFHESSFLSFPLTPSPINVARSSAVSAYQENEKELRSDVDRLLDVVTDEPYRSGMFGRAFTALSTFLERTSVAGVRALTPRLFSTWTNAEVKADVVRLLGQANHPPTTADRCYLAEHLLRSESPQTRDSAALALADMENPRGVRVLEEAIEREPIPSLKADMKLALEDLAHVVSSPEG